MDESYVIPVLTELREMRAKTYKLTDFHAFTKLKEDDCKFILSRAIELIEYLDGELENLDRFRDLAISRNKEFKQELERSTQLEQRIKVLTAERDLAKKLVKQKAEEIKRHLNEKYGAIADYTELKAKLDKKCREVGELTKELSRLEVQYGELQKECSKWKDSCHTWQKESTKDYNRCSELLEEVTTEREKSTQLEQRCSELVIDRDKAVEYWTKHCEGLLQKHREELATKDREIYELKLERDKNSDSVTYWKCKCHKLEKAKANNPANFCGNCRHYAQMGKDDGDFEGICTQHYIKRVDPDDASCSHFESNQVDRVTVGKPEFPCCDHCNREDCDNCTLCPF